MYNKDLIQAFKQGVRTGNCVAIATIKASIEVFGLNNVFYHQWDKDLCKVVMRDGYELEFTKNEFEIGKKSSEFILLGRKDIFEYANLCFTAMVKRAQLEENDEWVDMSFESAARTLNNGEDYLEGSHWIGLRQNVRSIGRRYIWHYKGVFGASKKHCFFVSKKYEDSYGKAKEIDFEERKFCKWFRFSIDSVY